MTENTCFSFDTSSAIQPFQLLIEGAGEIRPVEKLTGFPSRPAPYSRPASVDEPLIAHRDPGLFGRFVEGFPGRCLPPGVESLLHRFQHGFSGGKVLRSRFGRPLVEQQFGGPVVVADVERPSCIRPLYTPNYIRDIAGS